MTRYIPVLPAVAGLPIPGLYMVGGCVRDALIDKIPADIDVCSAVMPEQVCALTGGEIVNRRLGTVLIRLSDGTHAEHTTFRTESYGAGGGHEPREIFLGASLEQDALRRDFSVNALYARAKDGAVIDPTGRGLSDIEKKRLRTTTADPRIIIDDDALRLLRMVRFASRLGFSIDPELFSCAAANAALLADISPERIWAELCLMLLPGEQAAPRALWRALMLLKCSGLLVQIFPEFAGCEGIGKCRWHKYDVLRHCVEVCALTPPALDMRLAGLLHDVGKYAAAVKNGNMHRHDEMGAKLANAALLRLRAPNALRERVCRLISLHMYDLTGRARENTLRRAALRIGREDFFALADLREADIRGSGMGGSIETAVRFREVLEKMRAEGVPFSVSELAIGGRDIMALGAAGREVGAVLGALLAECAIDGARNERERLLRRARLILEAERKKA